MNYISKTFRLRSLLDHSHDNVPSVSLIGFAIRRREAMKTLFFYREVFPLWSSSIHMLEKSPIFSDFPDKTDQQVEFLDEWSQSFLISISLHRRHEKFPHESYATSYQNNVISSGRNHYIHRTFSFIPIKDSHSIYSDHRYSFFTNNYEAETNVHPEYAVIIHLTHRVGLSNSRSSRNIQHLGFGQLCLRKMAFNCRYLSTVSSKAGSLYFERPSDR